jgi:hypothetical protein
MTLRIHRQFIATVAALAIAITGISAAPARAGDNEVAAAIAVLLGLAVVGTVINKRNDDKKTRQHAYTPRPHVTPNHVAPRDNHIAPRPLPREVNRKLLPQRCLNRHYQFSDSLPQQCGRRVWSDRGAGYGFAARCLNKHGYQLARR